MELQHWNECKNKQAARADSIYNNWRQMFAGWLAFNRDKVKCAGLELGPLADLSDDTALVGFKINAATIGIFGETNISKPALLIAPGEDGTIVISCNAPKAARPFTTRKLSADEPPSLEKVDDIMIAWIATILIGRKVPSQSLDRNV